MTILLNDIIQYSDAPKEIKSPALSDIYYLDGALEINLNKHYLINSIGIGNSIIKNKILFIDGGNAVTEPDYTINGGDATSIPDVTIDGGNALTQYFYNIKVTFDDHDNTVFNITYKGNGLYLMPKAISAKKLTIEASNIRYLGRIAAGIGVNIPTSITKEPGWGSTNQPRTTLSGQVIPGVGGYNFRTLSLDVRYKIDKLAIKELEAGLKYIGMGYPFFIVLKNEAYKLTYDKFYGTEKSQNNMVFQSGVYRFLYSRKFDFEERF